MPVVYLLLLSLPLAKRRFAAFYIENGHLVDKNSNSGKVARQTTRHTLQNGDCLILIGQDGTGTGSMNAFLRKKQLESR